MATFKDRLKQLRLEKKITLDRMADDLNTTKASLSRYENGLRDPKTEFLNELANYFGVTVDFLMGRSDARTDGIKPPEKGVKIPVLGAVAAGIPIEAIENVEDYEEIPQSMASTGEYFALKIKGTSMEPRFTEGDVVIVKKQDDIESGEIGVVIENGADATVKKIIKQENGILLTATNQSVYPPKFYDNTTIETLPVKILGKVVELRAKF